MGLPETEPWRRRRGRRRRRHRGPAPHRRWWSGPGLRPGRRPRDLVLRLVDGSGAPPEQAGACGAGRHPGTRRHRRHGARRARRRRGVVGATGPAVRADAAPRRVRAARRRRRSVRRRRTGVRAGQRRRHPLGRRGGAQGRPHGGGGAGRAGGQQRRSPTPPWAPAAPVTCSRASSARCSAQGVPTWEAACLGVHLHGAAGEHIRERLGDAGLMASDLLPELPRVRRELQRQRSSGDRRIGFAPR